ncbi:unnamed protein product [Trypanosoma congolense IL3000]|uniref:WGS project CAEQ00000000 data, annotated contig 1180 n=1 Tax=Trypanosoma congolense (strain IL3000) TaxID=1068625 RepID=F9W4H0_TRYCI|nr:unnamed protein product [Trypanosoma congolense IL3000]
MSDLQCIPDYLYQDELGKSSEYICERNRPNVTMHFTGFGSGRKISAPGFLKKKTSFLGLSGAVSPYTCFSISRLLDSSNAHCQPPAFFPRPAPAARCRFCAVSLRRTASPRTSYGCCKDTELSREQIVCTVCSFCACWCFVVDYLFAIGTANFSGSRSVNELH